MLPNPSISQISLQSVTNSLLISPTLSRCYITPSNRKSGHIMSTNSNPVAGETVHNKLRNWVPTLPLMPLLPSLSRSHTVTP